MITIYSKPNCGYCDAAKNWLSANSFEFEAVDITADNDAYAFVVGAGHKSVPQIYNNGEILVEGGFQGLKNITANVLREKLG